MLRYVKVYVATITSLFPHVCSVKSNLKKELLRYPGKFVWHLEMVLRGGNVCILCVTVFEGSSREERTLENERRKRYSGTVDNDNLRKIWCWKSTVSLHHFPGKLVTAKAPTRQNFKFLNKLNTLTRIKIKCSSVISGWQMIDVLSITTEFKLKY